MIRFLLMLLLLLPGAEFVASNTDDVDSVTAATTGSQFSMPVTVQTSLGNPLPASHGPANRAAMHHPPHPRDSKHPPGLLKDYPVKPVPRGPKISGANATQRTSTPHGTEMPVTAKSHALDESAPVRPVIRKGPTPANKPKMVRKPNISARYQSLPHSHHKNVTSKPETGHLKDSNATTGPKPPRTVPSPLRTTLKPGQKSGPVPSDKFKHMPVGLRRVMQLKDKTSNSSQLLNTLINQNSSFTNSIQHVANSLNSTFTTVKEAVPYELNSLHSQDRLHNFTTSVPNADQNNDFARPGLFGRVHLPVEPDHRVLQELKSKVKVRLPERKQIFNDTNRNLRDDVVSTQQPGLLREGKGPELTTQVSDATKLVTSATWTERTLDEETYSLSNSHGHVEAETKDSTHEMTGVGRHLHEGKKQTRMEITESRQTARNQTHPHKHRHAIVDQRSQESNTISQHNATLFNGTASSEPHKHHSKHLHNHSHPHSHSHHKHRSDHHTQRNHISQSPVRLNIQEESQILQSQSSPPQSHPDSVTLVQNKASTLNRTRSSPALSKPSFSEALQEHMGVLHGQSKLSDQAPDQTTIYPISITDSPTAIRTLNNMEHGAQTEDYQSQHTEKSTPRSRYSLIQTTGQSITTNQESTKQPQTVPNTHSNKTQGQPEMYPTHDELTTPMQTHQTTKNRLDMAFRSLPQLTTTKPGLTLQTQPETGISTHTQSDQSHQDIFTSSQSRWSKHRLPNLTTNPPVPLTVTLPFLVALSQSEPSTERPPDFANLVDSNTTETESFIDSFNGNKPHTEPTPDRLEESTHIEQTTNKPEYYSTEPEPQAKVITDQTDDMLTRRIGNSTHEDREIKHKTISPTQTGPGTESKTESFTPRQPTTASEKDSHIKAEATTRGVNVSTTKTEPMTDNPNQTPSTTNKRPISEETDTNQTPSTIKTGPITEETDTPNQTPSTSSKRPITEETDTPNQTPSTTKTGPITSETDNPNQTRSTTSKRPITEETDIPNQTPSTTKTGPITDEADNPNRTPSTIEETDRPYRIPTTTNTGPITQENDTSNQTPSTTNKRPITAETDTPNQTPSTTNKRPITAETDTPNQTPSATYKRPITEDTDTPNQTPSTTKTGPITQETDTNQTPSTTSKRPNTEETDTPNQTPLTTKTGPITGETGTHNQTPSTTSKRPITEETDTPNQTPSTASKRPITDETDNPNQTPSTTKNGPITEETDTHNQTPPTTKTGPITNKTDNPNRTPSTIEETDRPYRIPSSTNTGPIAEQTDSPNRTPSTTKSHTEPFSQTETTPGPGTHFTTNTELVTRHESESDTATTNNTESVTQSGTMYSRDKIGRTSQREPTLKTPPQPTTHYHHDTTAHKDLTRSIQPDTGTPTYPQQSTGTMPKLHEYNLTEESVPTEEYVPIERTLTPEDTSATAESGTYIMFAHNEETENCSQISVPAQGRKAFHPTPMLSGDPATTTKIYRSKAASPTHSVTSPPSTTFTPQTLGEFMSVRPSRDRIFIVEEQQPLFKVATINVTHRVEMPRSVPCYQQDKCRNLFMEEVTSAYMAAPGFTRIDILNETLVGSALEYRVVLGVRAGSPLTSEQELVLTNPTSLFKSLAPSGIHVLSAIHNASLAEGPTDLCADWFSCPRGFHCVPQRKLSALCLSPCHSAFCQNDGICIHRKGQEPVCQCPVGTDFWYMGPTCDYRMTHHRLAAIACAVVFCIIICAAAAVFILVRRFQTQILQQKVAQTQSSYRRFSRFDDVPTHFWCPSQTWLTTSASLNSLDNPAFSSSEEVFPLQALGSCVCGCQNGARSNAQTNPPEPPAGGPPRLETSCSSVNDLMIDSGKASDVSVCSWPMEPIHWTPFPILHQLSLQSPFHARRPHSYFEGMELVNTERSWTA